MGFCAPRLLAKESGLGSSTPSIRILAQSRGGAKILSGLASGADFAMDCPIGRGAEKSPRRWAMGTLIVTRSDERGEWPRAVTHALAFEGLLLGVFAAVWHITQTSRTPAITNILIVLSGLAMGIQSAAVRHLGVPGVATTYITGTLTSLVADFVVWYRSMSASSSLATLGDQTTVVPSLGETREARVGLLAAVFLVYALGALVGGILQSRSPTLTTLLPLVAVAVVVVNGSVRYRHSGNRHPLTPARSEQNG